jgi:hypothetical protein
MIQSTIREDEETPLFAYCARCRDYRLFIPKKITHGRYLVFSLLTGGIGLLVWLTAIIGKAMRPFRCKACGWHKPEFRLPLGKVLPFREGGGDPPEYGERPDKSRTMYSSFP